MRAWRVHELGEPEAVLHVDDVDALVPGANEVAIDVAAASLNFPDVLMCRGDYQVKPPLPFTSRTKRATSRSIGAPICRPVRPCSCTRAPEVSGPPRSNSGSLRARVIATAGGPAKVQVCRDLGAELVIDYRAGDFVDAVKEFTGGRFAEARTNHILIRNYSVIGVHWGLYSLMKPKFVHETHAEFMRLHEAGRIAPLISREIPMTEVPSALASLATCGTWGNIVARW